MLDSIILPTARRLNWTITSIISIDKLNIPWINENEHVVEEGVTFFKERIFVDLRIYFLLISTVHHTDILLAHLYVTYVKKRMTVWLLFSLIKNGITAPCFPSSSRIQTSRWVYWLRLWLQL